MKKYAFTLLVFFGIVNSQAQDSYTISGETLELKTEIDGNLDLLWNIIDGKYRYFVKTQNGNIYELKNTKGDNNKYQEEYKAILRNVMDSGYNVSVDKVSLTLPSLSQVIDLYNGTSDLSYQSVIEKAKPQLRLGVFGGLTNFPFVENPNNDKSPVFGAELEVISSKDKPRHSGLFQVRHTFESSDLEFSSTEMALAYRYRFVSTSKLGVYANVKFATLTFSNATITYTNDSDEVVKENENETTFDAPFVFGIGADYRISNRGFITFGYNQLFGLTVDNHDNFSTDFSLGFKMIL